MIRSEYLRISSLLILSRGVCHVDPLVPFSLLDHFFSSTSSSSLLFILTVQQLQSFHGHNLQNAIIRSLHTSLQPSANPGSPTASQPLTRFSYFSTPVSCRGPLWVFASSAPSKWPIVLSLSALFLIAFASFVLLSLLSCLSSRSCVTAVVDLIDFPAHCPSVTVVLSLFS